MKPWYKVVTPREDLREDRPLDASEFAVHLDQVRDGTAPKVYRVPAEFFERTFVTKSLGALASEVLRRLSGNQVETSAVFNLSTQFGGGKTHALTTLLGGRRPLAEVDPVLQQGRLAVLDQGAEAPGRRRGRPGRRRLRTGGAGDEDGVEGAGTR